MTVGELRKAMQQVKKTLYNREVKIGDNKIISAGENGEMTTCKIEADFPPVMVDWKAVSEGIEYQKGPMTLTIKDGALRLDFVDAEKYIPTNEKFPEPPTNTDLIAELLLPDLHRISFCCAKYDARYSLTGILLDLDATVTLVASDTHRLSRISNAGRAYVKEQVIIPLTTIKKLPKTGHVQIYMKLDDLVIRGDNWEVSTRIVDGTFPRHNEVIPNNAHMWSFDRIELLRSLNGLEDTVSLKGLLDAPDIGKFSVSHLIQALEHFTYDTLTMRYEDKHALRIDEGNLVHIIMPVMEK